MNDYDKFVVYTKMKQLSDEAEWIQKDLVEYIQEKYGCNADKAQRMVEVYSEVVLDIDCIFDRLLLMT